MRNSEDGNNLRCRLPKPDRDENLNGYWQQSYL